MAAFLTLINFTDQGVHGVKDTVNRAQSFVKVMEANGARKIGVWWSLGQYDLVLLSEAPDAETHARLLLMLGMAGNVRTTSQQIFSEDEMAKIVAGLP
jgi:uncharacterized protein with GYD domain